MIPVCTHRIEGGWLSQYGPRLSAARIRSQNLQELRGLRAAPFQNVVLASAPRTFIFKFCKRTRT
eukprot:7225841-Pyramimonas_sp.AAC.1